MVFPFAALIFTGFISGRVVPVASIEQQYQAQWFTSRET
jgi:hypothetical protein